MTLDDRRHRLSSLSRVALFAAVLAVLPLSTARAGGAVLAPVGTPAPGVAIRMAIAVGPETTTRWSEVTVPAGPALGWLVPVRPGGKVDWAPASFLDALDDASAPRIRVPQLVSPCNLHPSFEEPAPWVEPAAALPATAIALPASAADAVTWATEHDLALSTAEADRVRALYTSGWRVAAIELGASVVRRTSPTLRVTDDGGAILPLSIGASTSARPVSLFVIGAGTGSIAGTRELGDTLLTWGASGSSYAALRTQTLSNGGWLRESASHALFDAIDITTTKAIAPVVQTYLGESDCAAQVRSLGTSAAPQPAAQLTCDDRSDLAVALAGIAPANAVLTRLAGVLPAGTAAGTTPVTVVAGEVRSPVRTAWRYDHACPASGEAPPPDDGETETTSSSGSSGGARPSKGSGSGGGGSTTVVSTGSDTTVVYVPSDGCTGDTTAVETDDTTDYASDSSDDSCSGDSSSSSSDGWDSSDSSSSDDSCSGDSTSSSSDGWDSSDSGDCAVARMKKRRGPSRFSRGILFAVALLLPLRRYGRRRAGGIE